MTTQLITTDCLSWFAAQPDDHVDLVFGSPPYVFKGKRYGDSIDHRVWNSPESWSDHMLKITREAARVCRSWVLWVCESKIRRGEYQPAVELLMCKAWQSDLVLWRPAIWTSNKPPSNHTAPFFKAGWEYVVAFHAAGKRPYFDWKPIAKPPEYKDGGRFRQRGENGKRRLGSEYPQVDLARPYDRFHVTVGGGHMGHKLASQGEAPFPVKLAEIFVQTCCPPGGLVCDPFIGSGTTAQAAAMHGRRCVGIDARADQIELSKERCQQSLA